MRFRFETHLFFSFLHPTRFDNVLTTTLRLDARRYFKQSEITLYRQAPEIASTPQIAQQQQIQQQQLLQQQKHQQPLPEGSATAGPGRESYNTPRVSAPAA